MLPKENVVDWECPTIGSGDNAKYLPKNNLNRRIRS